MLLKNFERHFFFEPVNKPVFNYYSFIPPSVSPETIYLEATRKTRVTGTATIKDADASRPHCVENWPCMRSRAKVQVRTAGLCNMTLAIINSFQQVIKENRPAIARAGVESGRSTRVNDCIIVAPSTRAASSSSRGMDRKYPLNNQMLKGMAVQA